jgi:hypothetical protein
MQPFVFLAFEKFDAFNAPPNSTYWMNHRILFIQWTAAFVYLTQIARINRPIDEWMCTPGLPDGNFGTKNSNFGKFWKALELKLLAQFTPILYILYIVSIWCAVRLW